MNPEMTAAAQAPVVIWQPMERAGLNKYWRRKFSCIPSGPRGELRRYDNGEFVAHMGGRTVRLPEATVWDGALDQVQGLWQLEYSP